MIHYNLIARTHPRWGQWAIDYDYINKLKLGAKSKNERYRKECEEALAYLDKFTGEFYKGSFGKDKIHPDELKTDCYNRNNYNARDVMSYGYRWNDLVDIDDNSYNGDKQDD